jgi:hypothetical protein
MKRTLKTLAVLAVVCVTAYGCYVCTNTMLLYAASDATVLLGAVLMYTGAYHVCKNAYEALTK